jgi:hypothetical protein
MKVLTTLAWVLLHGKQAFSAADLSRYLLCRKSAS